MIFGSCDRPSKKGDFFLPEIHPQTVTDVTFFQDQFLYKECSFSKSLGKSFSNPQNLLNDEARHSRQGRRLFLS